MSDEYTLKGLYVENTIFEMMRESRHAVEMILLGDIGNSDDIENDLLGEAFIYYTPVEEGTSAFFDAIKLIYVYKSEWDTEVLEGIYRNARIVEDFCTKRTELAAKIRECLNADYRIQTFRENEAARFRIANIRDLGERRVVVYGAGKFGKWVVEKLQSWGIMVHCFCDSAIEKQGTMIQGVEVCSPNDYASHICDIEKDVLIIAVGHPNSVNKILARVKLISGLQLLPLELFPFFRRDEMEKTILLLGDSISIGYREYVRNHLAPVGRVFYPLENSMFSSKLLYDIWKVSHLDIHRGMVQIIFFNAGLWDIVKMCGGGVLFL